MEKYLQRCRAIKWEPGVHIEGVREGKDRMGNYAFFVGGSYNSRIAVPGDYAVFYPDGTKKMVTAEEFEKDFLMT